MDIIDPAYRYYVYTLAFPDGCVFYVGKGTGGRLFHHEEEAQRECECRKCAIIRSIWEVGGRVQRAIVYRTNDEQDAFEHEKTTIAKYRSEHLVNYEPGKKPYRPIIPRLREVQEILRARQAEREALYASIGQKGSDTP